MTSTRRTARFGVAALAALSLVAAACGDDSSDSGDSGPAAGSEPAESDDTTMDTAMTDSSTMDSGMEAMEPSGPACDSIPKDGEGSFEGMADDPAATAAGNNPELSTLVDAVTAAELGDTLNGEGPFTVFAPANAAFEPIPEADLTALLEDKAGLTNVLTFHVVPEQLSSTQLAEMGSAMSVQGGELTFAAEGETLSINDGQATVVCADVPVGNGTVHIIDGVLMPPA